MDHPCYKCGHSVEDGKPFCAECGAPQIRVALAESPAPPTPVGEALALPPDSGSGAVFPGIPTGALPVGSARTLQPSALGAAVAAVLIFLGLNPFVAALGAGFLAVAISRSRNPGTAIRAAAGAKIGALSGLLSFGISTLLEMLAVLVLHKGAEVRSEMIDKFQQAATRYPGPEVQPFLDFVKASDGFAIMLVASLIFGLAAFLVLGGLGGALGASVLGRRNRP